MTIGDTVRIQRPPPQRSKTEDWEERSKYLPNRGTVEYTSPHGWALVRVHSRRTGQAIYAEAFDVCRLRSVHKKLEKRCKRKENRSPIGSTQHTKEASL